MKMEDKTSAATLAATRNPVQRLLAALQARFALAPNDLLRDAVYRRLWTSVLTSSFGAQIMMLALPLTAAVLLHASPTQMGALTTMEILPFVLFSLPSGVWLDRVRKLPVYIAGEITLAFAAASIPLAWWLHALSIHWLYVVAFTIGVVYTSAGSASQIVLTQVVERDRLIEANAKNALASSGADVAGPGLAGALIKLLGAPVALLFDAALLLLSAVILRGIRIDERPASGAGAFWAEMRAGLRFVTHNKLLVVLASCAGGWQLCNNSATVVNILMATRTLGMSEQAVGLSYVCLGFGTVLASLVGDRISKRLGPGPSMTLGIGLCSVGWLLVAVAPVGPLGRALFAVNLMLFGLGAVMIFINFISLRQAVTPAPMLGRMTSTMRWLILIPAGPGALIGGWLGEHVDLRASLAFSGLCGLALTGAAWRNPRPRAVRVLPVLP
ncbi:MAG TPA: MFS transporter, partial [Burkholderiaceae bacterium]|nr:MFS transporter [Burkholderiaceae bacterium]